MNYRGFIIQASYRIVAGVPIVHLYGRLDDTRTFLVRDHRQRPHFWIAAADSERAHRHGARALMEPTLSAFPDGQPVARIDLRVPPDAPPLRDALHAAGIATYEADVRFAMRYLIDRNIRGGCLIDGEPASSAADCGVDLVFDDPELQAADVEFAPRVLSFDIETNPYTQRLLAISMYGCGLDEVVIVDPDARAMPENAHGVHGERDAIDVFCTAVRAADPDVLTGWNVIDFDLTFLAGVAKRLKHPFELGRGPGELRLRPARGWFGSGQATIPGRLVLDGPDLVRGAFVRMDEYSLDAVGRTVLGEGKAVQGDADDRIGESLDGYRNNLPQFALYARTDARLVLEILERLDLVTLAVARSRLTGMPLDRVAASIASFDFVYLSQLRGRGQVAPSVRSDDARVHAAQSGGHVFEPVTGLHDNVWVFDFKSLYPTLMRTFNIDPLTFTPDPSEDDIVTVGGAGFRRAPAVLPQMLAELFPRRAAARRAGNEVAAQAIKILMNSFYGVLGTPACRFYNPAIANAITSQGRHFLEWARHWFEQRGFAVLYGDTDSVFVASAMMDSQAAHAAAGQLAADINADLADYIRQRWQLDCHMELEFEKLYVRLLLPSVRGGSSGARKRYAGVLYGGSADEVDFVGMEVVRRDWTDLAKRVQRELYARLFSNRPVEAYLREVVDQLRAGQLDELLVYRKGLRKRPEDYTDSSPPHVVAARKSGRRDRVVRYIQTVAGPEPVDALEHEPDREHYLERQIRPVAEPVLATLALNFERVIGDDRQLGLF